MIYMIYKINNKKITDDTNISVNGKSMDSRS